MYVSESTFVHLRQAEDERQSRELEYRRIARERAAEAGSASGRSPRRRAHWFRRTQPVAQRRLSHP